MERKQEPRVCSSADEREEDRGRGFDQRILYRYAAAAIPAAAAQDQPGKDRYEVVCSDGFPAMRAMAAAGERRHAFAQHQYIEKTPDYKSEEPKREREHGFSIAQKTRLSAGFLRDISPITA